MHKVVPDMHAGMPRKPLVKYSATSYRNRLPTPTVVMPHKNSSQIVLGDRVTAQKRQFVSTQKNHFIPHSLTNATTNPAILAETTKWVHKQALK